MRDLHGFKPPAYAGPKGAKVRIVEEHPGSAGQSEQGVPMKINKIYVNGVDVGLIQRDSISVDIGSRDDVAKVTFTLMPSEIVIGWGDENPT